MKKVFAVTISFISLFLSTAQASEVYVKGQRGSWYLEVDGKPFYIKGVGCGLAKSKDGIDFLKMAKELGANAVRTWDTGQGTQEYFDTANSYGLKVAAGIWIDRLTDKAEISYIHNKNYVDAKRKEAIEYVKKFKDHPAILMWVIGNEIIASTTDPQERIALCRFLESLYQEIHKIDPLHPITYASEGIYDLKYLKEYVPSLDIIGINEYGSIRMVHGNWDFLKFDKPYVFTEYGASDLYGRPDINGCSIELSDENKAKKYADFAPTIFSFKGYNLGGFAFHLGETSQNTMTYWNINEGLCKRASFWKIYELYAGNKAPYRQVIIKKFFLSKIKDIEPQEEVEVNVDIEDQGNKNLTYSYALSSAREDYQAYYVNSYIPIKVSGKGNHISFKAPSKKGIYRFYCFVKDGQGNITSANKSISVK